MASPRVRSRSRKSPPDDGPPDESLRALGLGAKVTFRIGEVAKLAGVNTSGLRFWETQFPSLRAGKSRTNQRLYTRKQVLAVLEVKDLLKNRGFTIEGAKRHLASPARGGQGALPDELREKLRHEVQELLRLVDE